MKFVKVKSKKKIGLRDTYDLKVKSNQNFFLSNGLLSHNCASTQEYFETDTKFTGGIDEVMIMKVAPRDYIRFVRNFDLTSQNASVLSQLSVGRAVLLDNLRDKSQIATTFKLLYSPYCHREKGYEEFMTYWKMRYPTEIINYKELIKQMKEKKIEALEKHKLNYNDMREESKKEKADEIREKQVKKEIKEQGAIRVKVDTNKEYEESEYEQEHPTIDKIEKKHLKSLTNDVKSKIKEEVYSTIVLIDEQDKKIEWKATVHLFPSIESPITLQKYFVETAIKNNDYEIIKKLIQKRFITRYFSEYYGDIYGKTDA